MLERKIYQDIVLWHESLKTKKRALIIKGVRQVGKTTIVKEFCKANYENVVYIDFMHNPSIKKIFEQDLTVKQLLFLMNYKNVKMQEQLLSHLWKMVVLMLFVLVH